MPKNDEIFPLVEELVKQITGINEEDAIESVVESVTLALCDPHCEIPDKTAIQRNVDGLVLKFQVHGFSKLAEDFDKNVKLLVNNKEVFAETPDLPWNMLKLLLPLSWKPMEHAQQVAMGNASNVDQADSLLDVTEVFDWVAYLREGDETLNYEEEESDSDWSQLSECKDEGKDAPSDRAPRSCSPDSDDLLPPRDVTPVSRGGPTLPTSHSNGSRIPPPRDVTPVSRGGPTLPTSHSYGSGIPSSTTNFLSRRTFEEERHVEQVSSAPLQAGGDCLAATSSPTLSGRSPEPSVAGGNQSASCASHGAPDCDGDSPATKDLLQIYADGFEAGRRLDTMVPQSYLFAAEQMRAFPSKPIIRLDLESDVAVLPEYFVLREVLWLFLSSEENRCFGLDDNNKFKPRPDFTILDVSVEVLWDFLDKLCPYFDMIREFRLFRDDIHDETGGKSPPNTYKAYHYAVEQYVTKFTNVVSNVMNIVAKQEKINSLLSVRRDLQPSLDELQFITNLHRKAVCDWRSQPNWFAAIRLLTVLYWSLMDQSFNPRRAAVVCDIFLKSFHSYATIIDMWLTRGVNVDFNNEFVVYRADNLENSMHESWDGGFFVRPYRELLLRDLGLPPPTMLDNVINEIVLGCKSVYIVVKLDKLISFTREGRSTECVLFDEFLSGVETGCAAYRNDPSSSPPRLDDLEDDSTDNPVFVLTGEANPMAEYITDPFLRLAFKDFIQFEDDQEIEPPKRLKKFHIDVSCNRIKWYTSSTSVPYEGIMEGVFESLVLAKYAGLGHMINTVMRDEVKLCHHLKTLRAVFMLETGDIMAVFSGLLALKVKDEPFWLYSQYLTSHLSDYFERRFQGSNHFRILVSSKFLDNDPLKAIEGIELSYAVEWPLSLIINDANLSLYNEIFRLLLRLKWTLTSLERLRHLDLRGRHAPSAAGSLRLARWQTLRFWLLNAVAGIHGFTMGHVIDSFSARLDDFVNTANDFDLLIDAHNKYVRMVHQLCTNPFEDSKLLPSFGHLLTLSHCLADLWSQGSHAALDHRLGEMEEMYCKLHTAIGLQLVDFSPLDNRIQIDSLISVFYYPLRPTIGSYSPADS